MVAWLASLTADPDALHLEPPKAAAAILVARASLIDAKPAPPDDDDEKCDCPCVGGWIVHGDGHRTPCACKPECECRRDD